MLWRNRFSPSLFLYLLIALAGLAVGSRATAATACVWRVTNVPVPFYLVGTIHALSGKDYPLPKAYDQMLHDSQRLLFEVNLTPKSENEFGILSAKAAKYPKGEDIRAHIHAKTWQFLAKNFRISGYFGQSFWWGETHFEGIEQMRAWAIAEYIWQIRGYNDVFSSHGVDRHLAYQARRLGKEIAGLAHNSRARRDNDRYERYRF